MSQRKSSSSSSSVPSSPLLESGKVRKDTQSSASSAAEYVEMQLYLSKLRALVPNMPKDRKVSKVEVINNVIDYICTLQTALIDQLNNNELTQQPTQCGNGHSPLEVNFQSSQIIFYFGFSANWTVI